MIFDIIKNLVNYKIFANLLMIGVVLISCTKEVPEKTPQKAVELKTARSFDYKLEIAKKMIRLKNFLTENKLDGILITQVRNVYWATAGLANNQIVLNKDVGTASLLFLKNGKKFLICNGAEASRMMDESLKELGYELIEYPWYESNSTKDVRGEIIKQFGRIGSDINYPNTINVSVKFKTLRYSLNEYEVLRYKYVAEQSTEAVAEVCMNIKPGMSEFEIETMTANALRNRQILPTVLLTAVDERIYKYRHALPGGAKLKKYVMINICAEKWGMPIAVTRFVHFGQLPEILKARLEKTAIVNAHYQEFTRPGVSAFEIFEKMKNWYKSVSFVNEWMLHHQGGAIGYDDREWIIYPGNKEVVQNNQAFAWNPTITGAKVEETMIVNENGFEVITKSPNWPMIIVNLNGKKYPQPNILIRDENTLQIKQQSNYEIIGE
ncbi:MAG: M24 family metallopeptidase [Ignavibacteria bacterium]|nr:M24 family metallopeptidase [Ignavibacteria bacterium]